MPEPDGTLTPADRSIIHNWLVERWKNRDCPVCGTSNWIIGNHALRDEFATKPLQTVQMAVPYVALFCVNCGYTIRFNAAIMGLFAGSKPTDQNFSTPQTAPAPEPHRG